MKKVYDLKSAKLRADEAMCSFGDWFRFATALRFIGVAHVLGSEIGSRIGKEL